MPKTYTELEAWGIFFGAIVIGIVVTSVFWAFVTVPQDVKKIEKEIENATKSNKTEIVNIQRPEEFITFCRKVDGAYSWDSSGFRQCVIRESSEKNLITMDLLCKKFNLTLGYGSYGVKCEGTA